MIEAPILTLDQIEDLAQRALVAAGTSEANARPLARATAATEADSVASHGLAYIPIYCEHVRCGKVDGRAQPVLSRPAPAVIAVDAATGFAHPAIDLGFEALRQTVERLAGQELLSNLTLEFDAVGSVSRHELSSFESPAPRSIPFNPPVRPQGPTPLAG